MEDIEEVICAEGSYPPAIIGQKVNILSEVCIKQHFILCVLGFVSQTLPFPIFLENKLGLSWAKLSSSWDLTLLQFFENLPSLN